VSQERFRKQQLERARRERAAAKFARRDQRRADSAAASPQDTADQARLLAELAALHARFDAGDLELDDFLEARTELTRQLDIA
jgi:hypothetical protein